MGEDMKEVHIDPFMTKRDAMNARACNRQLTLSKRIYHIVLLVSIYFDNIYNFIIYCIYRIQFK